METSDTNRLVAATASVLQVSGEDSERYLQSQVTQDLSQLEDGGCVYSLWLNDRGKIEGDSYILRSADLFYLISLHTPAELLFRLVERHIIADDVEVSWWAQHAIARGVGDGTELTPAGDQVLQISEQRGESPLRLTVEMAPPGGESAPVEDGPWTRERILRRIPAIPEEVGPRDTPFDLCLVDVAMSFSKGCYLGQEVMAKLNSRGRDRFDLYRLRGELQGERGAAGRTISAGGEDAGRLLCEWSEDGEWLGLAQLRRAIADAGAALSLEQISAARIF